MNAWDDTGTEMLVVMNQHRQHSLWPDFADIPAGWVSVFGPATAQECRVYLAAERPERDLEP